MNTIASVQNSVIVSRSADGAIVRSGVDSAGIVGFASKNSDRCIAIVAGLMEKTIVSRARKLSENSSCELSLDSLLNELAVSASGRLTREAVVSFLTDRLDSLGHKFCSQFGKPFPAGDSAKLAKLSALVAALIDRVAISVCARSGERFAASESDLLIVSALDDLPEQISERIASLLEAMDF